MPHAAAAFLHASLGAALRVQSLAFTESKLAGLHRRSRTGASAATDSGQQRQQLTRVKAALMMPDFLDDGLEGMLLAADGEDATSTAAALAVLEVEKATGCCPDGMRCFRKR